MSGFECERRDVRDGTAVEATSVAWNEGIEGIQSLTVVVLTLLVVAAAGAVLLGLLVSIEPGGRSDPGSFWMAAAGAVGAGVVIHMIRWPRTWRNLAFHRDGTVVAPHGVPFRRGRFVFANRYTDIVSIETVTLVEREPGKSAMFPDGVAVFTRSGGRVTVAKGLTGIEAHKVAVQLTSALQDLRSAVAVSGLNGKTSAGIPASPMVRAGSAVLID